MDGWIGSHKRQTVGKFKSCPIWCRILVDSDDRVQWEGDFGGLGSDADGDGDSDGADLLAWQRQFGSGVEAVASSQTVPELSAALLLGGLAAVIILAKRKLRVTKHFGVEIMKIFFSKT